MKNINNEKPLNVIVVDDNQEFLKSAAAFLSIDPAICVLGLAISGGEALVLLEKLPIKPDVILTDLAMPGMNGLELTRYVKRIPEAPRVIILSFNINLEYRSAAIEAGADAIMEKSDISESLLPLIKNFFEHQLTA